MLDPYLYEDVSVLKNLLGIKDAKMLKQAEADITAFNLSNVDGTIQYEAFDLPRLLAIHNHIFGNIYERTAAFGPRVLVVVAVFTELYYGFCG